MNRLVFDTPEGVRISVQTNNPLLPPPDYHSRQRQWQRTLAYPSSWPVSLLDSPSLPITTTQTSHIAGAGYGGAIESTNNADGDDDENDSDPSDPIVSAMGHHHKRRRRDGKFKQSYCAPGVKSKIKLDGVPPAFGLAAGVAATDIATGGALATTAALASPFAFGAPALATTAALTSPFAFGAGLGVSPFGFGAGLGVSPLGFGTGFGAGAFAAPALAATTGCGGLAFADRALGFGFPGFSGF